MPGWPDVDLCGHADHVGQAHRCQSLAKRRLGSIARIGQHAVPGCALAEQVLDLCQGDRRLGGELDVVLGHARLGATRLVIGPLLGQVQPPGHRKAAALFCKRHADRHLAVVLLAQHPAVLAHHTHRVRPLLGKTGVIDNPRHHRAVLLHGRQHLSPHLRQHLFIVPWCVRHKMVERLVHLANIVRG